MFTKRTVAFALTILMLFTFAACAGKKDGGDEAPLSDGKAISFSTFDVNGASVNSAELFAANKVTMINVWASWCGPCAREIPELQELSAELDELGCGLVGILIDGDTDTGLATGRQIISANGVTYVNLLPNDSINSQFPVQYLPTTFFVDGNGMLIGDPIVGAQVDQYLPAVQRLLDELKG